MLRRVAAFCRPLRPVLLLVSFPRSRSPVVGVRGLCWMWRDVPFAHQRRPVVGVLGVVLVVGAPPPTEGPALLRRGANAKGKGGCGAGNNIRILTTQWAPPQEGPPPTRNCSFQWMQCGAAEAE